MSLNPEITPSYFFKISFNIIPPSSSKIIKVKAIPVTGREGP
jgi:hypothetical protein